MNDLSAFMSQNAAKVENVKLIASPRFTDGKEKPIPWEITCITPEEDEALRKDCVKRVRVPGRRNQFSVEADGERYLGALAVRCTVYPNLHDVALQESYGVRDAEALLKRMLTPGEYVEYRNRVQEVNGYDIAFEELVDDAKN